MYRLFFSYRTSDKKNVSELISTLQELMPNLPFCDVSIEIPYTEDWKTHAASIIESCDGVVCIVGPDTHLSEAIDWEVREAYRLRKPLIATILSEQFKLPAVCKELQIDSAPWQPFRLAGQIGELLLSKALFYGHDWKSGNPQPKDIWNQYKLMVQSWETLISRRQTVNTLYVSANAALLAGIGVLISAVEQAGSVWVTGGVAILAFLGAALSFNWRRTVVSYGILSRAKGKVVEAFEAFLPAKLFDAEWKVLEAKRYKSTTDTDKQSAIFFMLLFATIFVIACGVSVGLLL